MVNVESVYYCPFSFSENISEMNEKTTIVVAAAAAAA